jgi:hypothetical protein
LAALPLNFIFQLPFAADQ